MLSVPVPQMNSVLLVSSDRSRSRSRMSQLILPLMLLLLAAANRGAEAGCARVDNQDLIEYSCEGGTLRDLEQVPANAEKIRISGMQVGRLAESQLARYADLVVFACSHCQISDIEDGAFRNLKNLQQLSLDNNRLKEVRAAWFEGLVYLTYLDLNYNGIERIEPDVFRNAPELVDLRLSGNRLLCLDLEALSRLRDLKRVFINENPDFGCPNALKRFLGERGVDFESDPAWSAVVQDPVRASKPLPLPPAEVHEPPPYVPTMPPPPPQPQQPSPSPSRPRMPAEVHEMIQPSVPEQDFPLQGPYYVPKVNQQQLDVYRNTLAQQAHNASEAARNRTADAATQLPPNAILSAGHSRREHEHEHEHEPPTTECPNAASRGSSPAGLLVPGLVLVFLRWAATRC